MYWASLENLLIFLNDVHVKPLISAGLSELLKERADLAAQVKKLRDEVSKRKRMIKEGNFEPDLSPCPPCQLSEKGEESESDAVPFESNILSTLNKIQSRKASSARFLGNYPFKTEKLPSIDANDPKLVEMLQRGVSSMSSSLP